MTNLNATVKPVPHAVFRVTSPDTVAECWSGVGELLYKTLWKLTNYIPQIPAEVMEDSGPFDHVGHGNLADLWEHLTADEALALNALAVAEEEKFEAELRKIKEGMKW